jgi:molybdopterin/thiamine biosynthesis adenylyltransferase
MTESTARTTNPTLLQTDKLLQPPAISAIDLIAGRLDLRLLLRGRIVVVGLGGVGSIVSRYLTIFLAAFSEPFRLLFCDGDAFEPGNSYRIDVPSFENKAVAMASELSRHFSREGLSIRALPEYLTDCNCRELVAPGDCVILCVDNHATRKLASQRMAELEDGILISGGNEGVETGQRGTYGNVQVWIRENGQDVAGAPLDRFHPEIADPADKNPDELDCMELAAQGTPQLSLVNLAVASAMLSAVLRIVMPPPGETMYDEVCLDILDAKTVAYWVTRPQQTASPFPNKPR